MQSYIINNKCGRQLLYVGGREFENIIFYLFSAELILNTEQQQFQYPFMIFLWRESYHIFLNGAKVFFYQL